MKPVAAARGALGAAELLLLWVSGATILTMMLVTTASAAARHLLNNPIVGSDVIVASILAPAATYLCLARGLREGRHVALEGLVRRLGERPRRVLHIFTSLLTAAILALVAWQSGGRAVQALQAGQLEQYTGVPMGLVYSVVPLGCGLASLSMLWRALSPAQPGQV